MKHNTEELNSFPCNKCIVVPICRQLYHKDDTYIMFKQDLSDKCELFGRWWDKFDETTFDNEYIISYYLCQCFNIKYRAGYEYEI